MVKDRGYDLCRYEVAIGTDVDTDEVAILAEKVILLKSKAEPVRQKELFPARVRPPHTILTQKQQRNARTVVKQSKGRERQLL